MLILPTPIFIIARTAVMVIELPSVLNIKAKKQFSQLNRFTDIGTSMIQKSNMVGWSRTIAPKRSVFRFFGYSKRAEDYYLSGYGKDDNTQPITMRKEKK